MVREIRVPSSSSSSSARKSESTRIVYVIQDERPTNCDGFDPHTLFDVCVFGIISILVLEDLLATEGVDEGRAS